MHDSDAARLAEPVGDDRRYRRGLAYGFESLHLVRLGALGRMMIVDAKMRVRATRSSGRPVGFDAVLPPDALIASTLAMSSWLVRLVEVGNPYPVPLTGFDDDCVRPRAVGRHDRNALDGRPLDIARIVSPVDFVPSGAVQ